MAQVRVSRSLGMGGLCGVRGSYIIAFLEWMGEKWGAFGTSELYPGVDG
jgi:hypothetical protein